jgi:hypothetical protein
MVTVFHALMSVLTATNARAHLFAQSASTATMFLHAEFALWVTINHLHHPSNALRALLQLTLSVCSALLPPTVWSVL